MSDDLSAIHAQTSAILEKLYDQRGQPDELNEDFIEEYFELVKDDLDLDDEEDEDAALGPRKTEAKLSQQQKGLIEVYIPDKKEKFVVSTTNAVKTLSGTSQRFGSSREPGRYVMTMIKTKKRIQFPQITIKSGSTVVIFVGLPTAKVQSETGKGVWKTT